jgi:uncharacterized membrane protein YuzA (DUF378 family)
MKHSQTIGIAAAICLMVVCFLPWSYIPSHQITVSGFKAAGTDFGKPGLFNFFLSVVMLAMYAVPAIWSKRTNVFLGALNLAWAFRNYLLLSACLMGECPEKQPALYVLVGLTIVMQIMTLLPKLQVKA